MEKGNTIEELDLYQTIKDECDRKGVSINRLCKEAGVGNMTVFNWKQNTPKTVEIYNKLVSTLNEIECK